MLTNTSPLVEGDDIIQRIAGRGIADTGTNYDSMTHAVGVRATCMCFNATSSLARLEVDLRSRISPTNVYHLS
jgi:hypothetical protein